MSNQNTPTSPISTPSSASEAPAAGPLASKEAPAGQEMAAPAGPASVTDSTKAAPPAEESLPSLTPTQLDKLLASVKRKVTVDGEDKEIGLDELTRDYQLREASMKRFQEASGLRKQLQDIIRTLKENPEAALAHELIGHDPRQVAEAILSKHLQQELLTPEEREREALRQERDALLARIQGEQQSRQAEQERAAQEARSAAIEGEIQSALSEARIPVSEAMLENMREVMRVAAEEATKAGQAPFTAKDLVDVAKGRFKAQLAKFFGDAPGDMLAEFLGEAGLKKVRSWDLGRLKTPAPQVPAAQQPPKKTGPEAPKGTSTKDILAKLRAGRS